jgi:hypothetical protein
MPAKRSRGSAAPPLGDRRQGVQHVLLHTLPGRAIVVGLAARIAIYGVGLTLGTVPGFLGVVDTVAGVVLAAGAAYFVFQLLIVAKRRLLWRVRRKLILSYFFVGFIPVLLIVSFFLLCGLLLFFNVSSYLVQSRLRAMEDRARFMAVNTALDIQRTGGHDVTGLLARRQAAAAHEFPDASFAVVPVARSCPAASSVAVPDPGPAAAAGSWAHVEPPRGAPVWIECAGYSGLFAYRHRASPVATGSPAATDVAEQPPSTGVESNTHLFVRATVFPESAVPRYAVVVDLPLGDQARRQLRDETGVEIKGMSAIEVGDARPLPGRDGLHSDAGGADSAGPLNWITFLDYRDWNNGTRGTLLVSTRPSISAM